MYALFALLRGSRTEMRCNRRRLTPCKKYSSNLPPREAAVLRIAQGDALFFAKSGQPLDRLTLPEKQVLRLIAEGKSTKRRRVFAWHQRKNSRNSSRQTHAEAGYS
jgi:hypothetical protein